MEKKKILVAGGEDMFTNAKLRAMVHRKGKQTEIVDLANILPEGEDVADLQTPYLDSMSEDELKLMQKAYEDFKFGHLTKKQREADIQPVRTEPKYQRNDPCPCGSGKKYKNCCINKQNERI
jgi:uncharacterized protein YecA (UPF0149 family)